MPLYDFECSQCRVIREELVDSGTTVVVCACGSNMERVWLKTPAVLTKIIPDYPGSKGLKAGYQHTSHAPQAATKVQSGYGGCQGPK